MAAHLLRGISNKTPTWLLKFIGNLWSPYFGAGIEVQSMSQDFRRARIRLKFRWYNKNYVGTQFGGSIYSMTDPFYMLMLMNNLGKDYIVWDKGAEIEFKRPGRTDLFADFRVDQKLIDEVKEKTAAGEKHIFSLPVEVVDVDKNLIAKINKILYVKKKKVQ